MSELADFGGGGFWDEREHLLDGVDGSAFTDGVEATEPTTSSTDGYKIVDVGTLSAKWKDGHLTVLDSSQSRPELSEESPDAS